MGFGKKKCFQCKCKIGGTIIFSKDKVSLLGITINSKLIVEAYLELHFKKRHINYISYEEQESFP